MKDYIALNKLVYDFLSTLSDEDISNALNGKAKIKLYTSPAPKSTDIDTTEIEAIASQIETLSSREEVTELLISKKLKKETLVQIANHYTIHINKSKDSKDKLLEKIVEGTIGAKLKYNALL